MDVLKKLILSVGVMLCGVFLATSAYDQALTSRHIIWCAMVIALVVCTKEIKVGIHHLLALGYLGIAIFTGIFALNKSEWLYSVSRISLMVSYLLVVKIDKKMLAKTMILLGTVFIVYFWYDYYKIGYFTSCRGLMRQRNFWAAAHFFVIPFCYYAINKGFWRYLGACVLAGMFLHIVLLNSRSAMLASGVALVVMAVVHPKYRKILFPILVLGAVGCVYKIGVGNLFSIHDRLVQWFPTLAMIADNPLGVGAGNWWIVFPKYAHNIDYLRAFTEISFRHPHNDFLWVCSEVGVVGFLCYLGMFATALYYAWKKKAAYLIMALVGYVIIASFSASRERAFASLMGMTFIAMACNGEYKVGRYGVRDIKLLLITILVFTMVVFGFRYRSSCWNKKLRNVKEWHQLKEMTQGYSVFSTLTYVGLPYHWWRGLANFKMGNKELAFEQYQTAYRHNPYNIHVINGMGIACGDRGERERAIKYFEEALKICPKFEDAQENLEKVK